MQDTIFQQVAWVVFLPVIGFLVQCLLGKSVIDTLGPRTGKRVMGGLAVAAVAGSFAIGVSLIMALAQRPEDQRAVVVTLFDWIRVFGLHIPFELRVDPLSMTMVMVITGIGSLIHLYATGYMAEEPDYPRFFAYLNLFVAFMLLLVLGNNLALLFIGWEGVGLCSYLLIGFWYKDLANSAAANKAFIVNRIGDVGLVLGMGLIVALLATNRVELGIVGDRWLSYDVMLPALRQALENDPGMATAVALCLFVGACGKSAQFPLYLWLPDAMAGPTPVSALIHAATMVTAGVVLLTRMQDVFRQSAIASAVVVVVGLFTALFAALIAFGQTDIKKVLAYSTVSQLGFMFVACGAGYYWVGMFHVITHAFFKALLFLGSGAVIHAMAHNQDMRNYGKLWKAIPITFGTMLLGYLAIAGVPLTSGWFSKEEIIHDALYSNLATVNGLNLGNLAGWTLFGGALLTAIYMTRMMMLTFFGPTERWKAIPVAAHGHHDNDHTHAHQSHLAHEDPHGFFMTDAEVVEEHDEHHHELDQSHTPHEVPVSMWLTLAVLAVCSVLAGVMLKGYKALPMFPKDVLEKWLAPAEYAAAKAHGGKQAEAIPYEHLIPILGYWVGIAGMVIGVLWYLRGLPVSEGWDLRKWNPFRRAAASQFGFDPAMMEVSQDGGRAIGVTMWRFDQVVVDGFLIGIGKSMLGLGRGLAFFQSGLLRSYALMMLVGSVAIIGYIVHMLRGPL